MKFITITVALCGVLAWASPALEAESTAASEQNATAGVDQNKGGLQLASLLQAIPELTQERERAQRELNDAQANLTENEDQLAKFKTSGGDQTEIKRLESEHEALSRRVTAAQAELDRINQRLREAHERAAAASRQAASVDVLAVGDVVEVMVLEDDTFNGKYTIRRSGDILVPRLGRVELAGKSLDEAEAVLRSSLETNHVLKSATVIVDFAVTEQSSPSQTLFLAGEFARPGPWSIPPGAVPTLLTTILQSGGTTDNADLSDVRLLRLTNGQQLVEDFNVDEMLKGKDLVADVPVKAGDIIVVPAVANLVYVTGNVKQPGPLKLPANETLKAYSAILRAGGFARFANTKKVYILRDLGGGKKQKIPVNIDAIQHARSDDVALQSNDIVVVPEKFFSF